MARRHLTGVFGWSQATILSSNNQNKIKQSSRTPPLTNITGISKQTGDQLTNQHSRNNETPTDSINMSSLLFYSLHPSTTRTI
jgi:hypothetical protein